MSGKVKKGKLEEKNATDRKDVALKEQDEGSLCWKIISYDQINTLLDLTVEQVQLQFEEILGFRKTQTSVKEAALLDYFVSGFWWAKEMKYTCQQVSFIMALLELLLDNISEKLMPLEDNLNVFATLISGARRSPSLEVEPLFDVDQAKSITDYITCSLFQNYQLYRFLFTQPREEVLLVKEVTIEVIRSADLIPPLEEGIPTDIYLRYTPSSAVEEGQRSSQEEVPAEGETGRREEQVKEHVESEGNNIQDVKLVIGDLTKEMLGNFQAEFKEN
ncbi:hypothetical protein UPYG_G00327990 [Umbra pygmaea]|uniref:Ciliary-associated calcium-binding coiled-coil protein 1 n=1 Tax=Umbra pygmaea TaxID=75934 RepID=A0ABD0W5Y3_UMBPY